MSKKKRLEKMELFFNKKRGKNATVIIFLIIISALSLKIRTSNMKLLDNKYLLALDPYIFYRYAKYYVENGGMLKTDNLRYFPEGFKVGRENLTPVYAIVLIYNALRFSGITGAFAGVADVGEPSSLMVAAQLYPAVFGTLSFIVFFFMVFKFFKSTRIAMASTALLAFSKGFLFRTVAGFADKDAIAMFFLFLAALGFVVLLEKKKNWVALLSGVLAGLAGLSWGGHIFLVAAVSLTMLVYILRKGFSKQDLRLYSLWFLPYFLMMSFLTLRYGGVYFFKDLKAIMALFPLVAGLVFQAIKKVQFGKPISIAASFLIMLLFGYATLGVAQTNSMFYEFFYHRLSESLGTERFTQTVSENQPTYFLNYFDQYGILTYFILAGFFLLIYNTFKKSKNKYYILFAFAFFVLNVIASRWWHGTNNFFSRFYYQLLILILLAISFLFHMSRKEKINWTDMHFIIWFAILFISVRGAVRLFFVFTPFAIAASSYFFIKIAELIPIKEKNYINTITHLFILYLVWQAYGVTSATAKSMGPGDQLARKNHYDWIKQKTPKDAVFIHWWDYGYWMQSLGQRASVLDGGNYRHPENVAKNLFCARNISTVKKTLESYAKPDYFLVDGTDIGKFGAIAKIAAEDTWFSYLQTGKEQDNLTPEVEYEKMAMLLPTNYFDTHGFSMPRAVVVPTDGNDNFGKPYFVIENNLVPGKCLCKKEECEFFENSAYPGCVAFSDKGILYLPEKTVDMFFTKLYILNQEIPGFEKVYDQGAGSSRTTIYKIHYDKL